MQKILFSFIILNSAFASNPLAFRDYAQSLIVKAIVASKDGQTVIALDYLTEAKQIKGLNKSEIAHILYLRSKELYKLKKLTMALRDLDQSIGYSQKHIEYFELRAMVLLALGKCIKANQDLSTLKEKNYIPKWNPEIKKLAQNCSKNIDLKKLDIY